MGIGADLIYGLPQPIADGVKLFTKEIIIPNPSSHFLIDPILSLVLAHLTYQLDDVSY